MAPQYGDREYWDERYGQEAQSFDWYQTYDALRPVVRQYIPLQAAILQVGVGTSRIQVDMLEDGYQNILNTDYSPIVIDMMREQHKGMKGLSYAVSDCRNMTEYQDETFDAVLDKGTLDAILCGGQSFDCAGNMLAEIYRVLKQSGVFVEVTYGPPDSRLPHLLVPALDWKVVVFTIIKPDLGLRCESEPQSSGGMTIAGPFETDDEEAMNNLSGVTDHHFMYVCIKGREHNKRNHEATAVEPA